MPPGQKLATCLVLELFTFQIITKSRHKILCLFTMSRLWMTIESVVPSVMSVTFLNIARVIRAYALRMTLL